jgi:Protein of unknown function (DUF3662)/FHA domain
MPLLRSIERRIEAIFEGAFGRAFRANVQPVEIARKLAKEMDDHRTASVTRVYVPNEYTVYLSAKDHDQFSSYEEALCKELQEYLSEHAQRERYALPSEPRVVLETDADLEIGVFGIGTKMARTDQNVPIAEPAPAPSFEPAAFSPDIPIEAPDASYALVYPGGRFPLRSDLVVLGRARECEIHLSDPNISRRHAEIRMDGGFYAVVDLGSTNGTELNGQRIKHARLSDGDVIAIGQTELTFVRE